VGGDGSSKENDNSNPSVASSEANHSKENIQQTVQGCSLLDSAVPCDMKHDSEVISNVSNCESDAVLNYLGGTPFVDTISPGISFESDADNSSKCKVTFPVSVEGSIKGRWQEPSLHQLPELRSCFNPDRADILPLALPIYIKAMKWAKIKHILVPKVGLADGIVRQLYLSSEQ